VALAVGYFLIVGAVLIALLPPYDTALTRRTTATAAPVLN